MSRFALPVLAVLLLTGCVSKVRDTGYLGQYTDFNTINKRSVKLDLDPDAFAAPAAVIVDEEQPVFLQISSNDDVTSRPIAFVVHEPEWAAPPAFDDPEKQEKVVFTVRERMYRYLLRKYPHPVRVRYAAAENDPLLEGHRIITISSAITDFKKGDGLLRYLLGYGLGKVYIQIEGEFFDGPGRDRKIGEFVIRRGHGGFGQNGMNPAVAKDDYAMLYAVEEAIDHLTLRLPGIIPGLEQCPLPKPEDGIVATTAAD